MNRFPRNSMLILLCCISAPLIAQNSAKCLFFLDNTSGIANNADCSPTKVSVAPKTDKTRTLASSAEGSKSQSAQKLDVADVKVPDKNIGLRYWIELQGPSGQLLRVTSKHVFQSGDRIRMHVEANIDGRLSILQSQDDGPFELLYPTGKSPNTIAATQDTVVPSATTWFRFDEHPGKIHLLLMLQDANYDKTRETGTQLASNANMEAARIQNRISNGSKALVVEDDTASAEPASYTIIDRRKDPKASVVATDILLAHSAR